MSPCSSVSHGLQSCVKIETPLENMCQSSTNVQEHSSKTWDFNFIQSSKNETEQVYVHPLMKRSASSLSSQSLEMCTESLGTETGSIFDSTNIDQQFSYDNNNASMERQSKQPKNRELGKKVKSFPPPLSSIDGFKVQAHREGGRLVIKAFSCSSYFKAERGNGRLRLSLIRDIGYDQNEDAEDEVKEENGIGVENNCEENYDDDEKEKEDEVNGCFWGENLRDGGIINGGEWSRWCNGDRSSGDSKTLRSLPFCVAIS